MCSFGVGDAAVDLQRQRMIKQLQWQLGVTRVDFVVAEVAGDRLIEVLLEPLESQDVLHLVWDRAVEELPANGTDYEDRRVALKRDEERSQQRCPSASGFGLVETVDDEWQSASGAFGGSVEGGQQRLERADLGACDGELPREVVECVPLG